MEKLRQWGEEKRRERERKREEEGCKPVTRILRRGVILLEDFLASYLSLHNCMVRGPVQVEMYLNAFRMQYCCS